MPEEKKERREEGQALPVRREERAIRPFEEWGLESPFSLMHRIRDDIDRMFSEFGFPSMRPGGMRLLEPLRLTVPAVDVWETDTDVMVRADLPGVDPNNIEIYTTQDSLRISAESRREEEQKEKGYYRAERRYGKFERTIDLPTEVKPGEAKALFKNGVLEVKLPKTEEARERMKKVPIEVQEEEMAGAKGGRGAQRKQTRGRSK